MNSPAWTCSLKIPERLILMSSPMPGMARICLSTFSRIAVVPCSTTFSMPPRWNPRTMWSYANRNRNCCSFRLSRFPSARSKRGFRMLEHLNPLATSYPANSSGWHTFAPSMMSVLCHTSSYSTFASTGNPTRVVSTGNRYAAAALRPRLLDAMLKR